MKYFVPLIPVYIQALVYYSSYHQHAPSERVFFSLLKPVFVEVNQLSPWFSHAL